MPFLRRPREPGPGECCGNGCARCVWDDYYDALAAYEAQVASGAQVEASSDEETSEETRSECENYIGSVVVQYLTPSTSAPFSTTVPKRGTEMDIIRDIDCTLEPISDVKVIKMSEDDFRSPFHAGVCLLDVATPSHTAPTPAIPGDVVDIWVPNTKRIWHSRKGEVVLPTGVSTTSLQSSATIAHDPVDEICELLHLDPEQWCELHRSPFVPENSFPPWLPLRKPLTIRHLLAYYVDLSTNAFLHPSFFESLFRLYEIHSSDRASGSSLECSPVPAPADGRNRLPLSPSSPVSSSFSTATAAVLQICASPEYSAAIVHELRHSTSCFPTIADFLRIFSFTPVSFDRFLELCCPLRPRKFSVVHQHVVDCCSPPSSAGCTDEKQRRVVTRLCMRQTCLNPVQEGARPSSLSLASSPSPSCSASSTMIADVVAYLQQCWNRIVIQQATASSSPMDGVTSTGVSAMSRHEYSVMGHVSGPLIQQGVSALLSCSSSLLKSSVLESSSTPAPQLSTASNTSTSSAFPFSSPCPPRMYLGTGSFGNHGFATLLNEAVKSLLSCSPSSIGSKTTRIPLLNGRPRLYLMGMGTGMAPLLSAVFALQQGWRTLSCKASAAIGSVPNVGAPDVGGLRSTFLAASSAARPPHPPFHCCVLYGARNMRELLFHEDLLAAVQDRTVQSYSYVLSRDCSLKPYQVIRDEDEEEELSRGEGEKHACPRAGAEEEDSAAVRPQPPLLDALSRGMAFRHITDLLEHDEGEKKALRLGLLSGTASVFACGPSIALQGLREWFTTRLLPSSCGGVGSEVVEGGKSCGDDCTNQGNDGIDALWDRLEAKHQIVFDMWNSRS